MLRSFRKITYGQRSSPNFEAGRSPQVITLVQQMLNLHRSAKDLPSTPVVRVVN